MGYYFEDNKSIFAMNGGDIPSTLRTVSHRYCAANPRYDLTYRAYSTHGIFRDGQLRYQTDFNERFPDARVGQYVYAWTSYQADTDMQHGLDINCICPTILYVNGEVVFRSTQLQERYPEQRCRVMLPVRKGDNTIVVQMRKTPAGFGMLLGTALGKFNLYFTMPSPQRAGQEGFLFTAPMDTPLQRLPVQGQTEADTGVRWYPDTTWPEGQRANLGRMFGDARKRCAVGWTMLDCVFPGQYELAVRTNRRVEIFIDGRRVASVEEDADVAVPLAHGRQNLSFRAALGGPDAHCEITCDGVVLRSPCNLWGGDEKWIYLAMDAADRPMDEILQLHHPVEGGYWRLDAPGMVVRPYNENKLYGQWNYPLGVTLYGLLSAAREADMPEVGEYVASHMRLSCDTLDYALWDREQYGGGTSIHNLLASIDSLDDCGSFGSAMLETGKHYDIPGFRRVADYVAHYISSKQARLEDGTFFRKHMMHAFHEDTMWADDLYMSIPFLVRYYQLTGDERYIDDCARQVLGFKKWLYMPEQHIMAHVYDFKAGAHTGVPWGRGNGWTAFSIAELLEVLPEGHALRGEVLAFFRELCAGYLRLQDTRGMWHQVLTDWDSYPESSCTSMFCYAFAKAVRNGWLEEAGTYALSALRGFEALCKTCVDCEGNLFGTCRGSEFSFTPDYYKYELLWNLNDTHGTGIFLLAGTELLRLDRFLNQSSPCV